MLGTIKKGEHVALLYRTRREQLACSIPFIKLGLAANERCLYISDNNPIPVIRKSLSEEGIDVAACEQNNSLCILTKKETYLRHGLFEPSKVVADLDQWISESLKLGFTGFRATGEMSWALDLPSSFVALLDYARHLETNGSNHFIGLCQFDETRFPKSVLDQIIEIHSKVIKHGVFIKGDPQSPRELS